MELNSAQVNAAIYYLARHVPAMRAEMNVVNAALTDAGIVSSDKLVSAREEVLSRFDIVFEQMKSYGGAHSMEAIRSVDALVELIRN